MSILICGVPVTSTASLKVTVTVMISPRAYVSPDEGADDTVTPVTVRAGGDCCQSTLCSAS